MTVTVFGQQLQFWHKISMDKLNHAQEAEYIVHGYIRRLMIADIPSDIIKMCLSFYLLNYQILRWSKEYKTNDAGLILFDNDKCVKRTDYVTNQRLYRWILPDIEPVDNGIHCWRVKISNPGSKYLFFGVSQKKMYADQFKSDKYDKSIYGISGGNYYKKWRPSATNTNKIDLAHFWLKDGEIDIYLDIIESEVKFKVVGLQYNNNDNTQKGEAKIFGLTAGKSWIPYLMMHASAHNATLRIAEIPIKFYGEEIDELWETQ